MDYLEHTCNDPAEDLALDEALLERAEQAADEAGAAGDGEVLRIWEMRRPAVVLGRSSQAAVEANLPECARRGVPVLRRTSGGAAIVAGPGCLMYSVVLSYARRPHLRAIDEAHRFVLGTVLKAIRPSVPGAAIQGTSDLAVAGRKFSGNSLRCRREHLLYHGTLLYDFPLDAIAACLGTPPRQPAYRERRPHGEFVMNLPLIRSELIAGLRAAFAADAPLADLPWPLVRTLVETKYGRDDWNLGSD
jgi:lipoate-protein ligase A